MSVRSMTGFAQVRKNLQQGEIVLSVKTVNHRGLDMHLHLPPGLDPFEAAIRRAIKNRVLVDTYSSISPGARSAVQPMDPA